MLGYVSRAKTTTCHVEVSIYNANNCGGFAGNDSSSIYENCTVSGTVSGKWVVGGFVESCSSTNSSADPSTASAYTNCTANVNVNGNDWRVGGFAGHAECGAFINCVSYGDITSSLNNEANPKVGGFIEESGNSDYAEDCYVSVSSCNATDIVTSVSSNYEAGGFIGDHVDCSFDKEKHSGLNAVGVGTLVSGVAEKSSAGMLEDICVDYYGGHQYSTEWTVNTEATCTTDGSMSHHCERCGAKNDVTAISAKGHSLVKTEAKDATCTEAGNIEYWYCENCKKYFSAHCKMNLQ